MSGRKTQNKLLKQVSDSKPNKSGTTSDVSAGQAHKTGKTQEYKTNRTKKTVLFYDDKDLQLGRRQRLWNKIIRHGSHVLTDQEILEICLYITNARRDTYNLAKILLRQFGNITNCILAENKALMKVSGISTNTVACFQVLTEFCKRFIEPKIEKKDVISNWRQVIEYLRLRIGRKRKEHILLLFLNNKNQLIQDEIHQVGTNQQVYIYPSELVKRCLELDAFALILAHNHPSDTVKPSKADIEQTQELQHMLSIVNIKLHDHIIVGPSNFLSFRSENIIS